MTTKMSIRELARNTNILVEYDYVEVEDKKSHKNKGLFVSPQYAEEVKVYLEKIISSEKEKKLSKIMKFAGVVSGDTQNLTSQEIKELKKDKYQ